MKNGYVYGFQVYSTADRLPDPCKLMPRLFRFFARCYSVIVEDYRETLKLCLPALIYTFQNNLYYVALTHLEAATYCVSSSMFA